MTIHSRTKTKMGLMKKNFMTAKTILITKHFSLKSLKRDWKIYQTEMDTMHH